MKQFSKEEIEGARAYFLGQEFPEVKVELGERRFNYFVIPQSQEPNLPNFVLRMTGKPENGYVLGISNNVRREFRKYAVAHEFIEFIEFTEIGLDTPHRCTRALTEELTLVPKVILHDYAKMRGQFFRDLVDYCSKQPEFYTAADIKQFEKNAKTLESLL